MRKMIFAALVATVIVPLGFLVPPAMASETSAVKYSVETTDLGTLLDDPGAKAVLEKHIPGLVGNAQIEMARPMTLKQLQQFAGDMLSDEALGKIQADLDKLPGKK